MKINTYLNFNGQCEEAFKFYEKCLDGKIEAMMAHEGTPAEEHVPPEWKKKIIHACLRTDHGVLMGSDAPPDYFEPPKGFSVALHFATPAEAEKVFYALANDGKITMPLAQTFWSVSFGMLVDKYGIPWMIHCEQIPS